MESEWGLRGFDATKHGVEVLGSDVRAGVFDLRAQVRIGQLFRNLSATTAIPDVSYRFPLDTQAAVRACRVRIGASEVCAELKSLERARTEYAAAVKSGAKAAMIEQRQADVFELKIGNVGPGEAVAVHLEYDAALEQIHGETVFRLPSAIAPRYASQKPQDPGRSPKLPLAPLPARSPRIGGASGTSIGQPPLAPNEIRSEAHAHAVFGRAPEAVLSRADAKCRVLISVAMPSRITEVRSSHSASPHYEQKSYESTPNQMIVSFEQPHAAMDGEFALFVKQAEPFAPRAVVQCSTQPPQLTPKPLHPQPPHPQSPNSAAQAAPASATSPRVPPASQGAAAAAAASATSPRVPHAPQGAADSRGAVGLVARVGGHGGAESGVGGGGGGGGALEEHMMEVIMTMPPLAAGGEAESVTRSTIQVWVDCSESMQENDAIGRVREALAELVASLHEHHRFTLVKFGSDHEQWSHGVQPYNDDSLRKARQWISRLDAEMGGTEIANMMHQMLKTPADHDFPPQVVLLTDGAVDTYELERATALAKRHDWRIHTIGIGAGVSRALVESVARVSGGISVLIMSADEVGAAVARVANAISTPAFTNVTVTPSFGSKDPIATAASAVAGLDAGSATVELAAAAAAARMDVDTATTTHYDDAAFFASTTKDWKAAPTSDAQFKAAAAAAAAAPVPQIVAAAAAAAAPVPQIVAAAAMVAAPVPQIVAAPKALADSLRGATALVVGSKVWPSCRKAMYAGAVYRLYVPIPFANSKAPPSHVVVRVWRNVPGEAPRELVLPVLRVDPGELVHRLGAKMRITELQDAIASSEENRGDAQARDALVNEQIATSLRYGVQCERTAFIAVDKSNNNNNNNALPVVGVAPTPAPASKGAACALPAPAAKGVACALIGMPRSGGGAGTLLVDMSDPFGGGVLESLTVPQTFIMQQSALTCQSASIPKSAARRLSPIAIPQLCALPVDNTACTLEMDEGEPEDDEEEPQAFKSAAGAGSGVAGSGAVGWGAAGSGAEGWGAAGSGAVGWGAAGSGDVGWVAAGSGAKALSTKPIAKLSEVLGLQSANGSWASLAAVLALFSDEARAACQKTLASAALKVVPTPGDFQNPIDQARVATYFARVLLRHQYAAERLQWARADAKAERWTRSVASTASASNSANPGVTFATTYLAALSSHFPLA